MYKRAIGIFSAICIFMGSVNVSIYAEEETKDAETAATESINNIITEMDIPVATETPDENSLSDEKDILNDFDLRIASVTGWDVVNYAYETWKGTPWRDYTHAYAPGVGIDCSALVQYSYNNYGFSVPRTTWEQRYCGSQIDISPVKDNHDFSQLQPGDLLFFNNYAHVGMYYGDGYFVHTAYSRGVVKQLLYGDVYNWNQYTCEIRRIIGSAPAPAPVHTHNWSYHNDASHPHRQYRTCSCGAKEYTGGTQQVASCQQCYPIGNASLTRSFNRTGRTAQFYRNNVSNAHSYTLTLRKDGSTYGTYNMSSTSYSLSNLASGTYTATLTAKNNNTGQTRTASCDSFKIVDSYPITYNANGGSGGPSAQTKIQNETLTLSSVQPTRAHYIFKGWATSKTATAPAYTSGGAYTKNTKATLYAVWEPETYTISFDTNGGKGEADAVTITYGNAMKMPNTIVRESYYLRGWATKKGATTPDYKLGVDYKPESNLTLYAVWGNSTWSGAVATGFAGGSGTKEDPYQIADASQLAYLANKVNTQTSIPKYEYYKLTDNINLRGYDWVPIGLWSDSNDYYQYFHGSFDGNGYTISDMSISYIDNSEPYSYIGLFGHVNNGEIKNLTITGDINSINISGQGEIGILLGNCFNTNITNCTASYVNISDISAPSTSTLFVGGLCGYVDGIMTDCTVNESYIAMQSGRYCTGLCAGSVWGDIINCTVNATDEIFGTTAETTAITMGGICGNVYGDIKKCTVYAGNLSNNIKMKNDSYVGGAVGYLDGTAELCTVQLKNGPTKMIDGISAGSSILVDGSGYSRVGGIVGYSAKNAAVTNCKYDGQSISNSTSSSTAYTGGITGQAIGKELTKIKTNGSRLDYSDMPTRDGYTATWYTDSTLRREYDFSKDITENLTLYAKWTEGGPRIWDGTSKEPEYNSATKTYTITNGEELAWVSDVSNGIITDGDNFPDSTDFEGYTIELANDIYLNDTSNWEDWTSEKSAANVWKPIGNPYSDGNRSTANYDQVFKGKFDGNNHTIAGLNKSLIHRNYGEVCKTSVTKGTIFPVTYSAFPTTNTENVGAIIGINNGKIWGCHSKNNITGNIAGGIVGSNTDTISYCSNSGKINGTTVGGISAITYGGNIDHCYNEGYISGTGFCGGIVGTSNSSGSSDSKQFILKGCYNKGVVEYTGDYKYNDIGGIIGYVWTTSIQTFIYDSHNSGALKDTTSNGCEGIGGIVGDGFGKVYMYNCYHTGNITKTNSTTKVGGIAVSFATLSENSWVVQNCYSTYSPLYTYATGASLTNVSYKSTSAMKNLSNLTGFSTSTWAVDPSINNGYPYLKELADTYTSGTSYTVTAVEDLDDAASISKCFVNVDGVVYGNSAGGTAYSGGIIGYAGGSNKSPATGLLAVGNKVSAVTGGSTATAYSGDIYGEMTANALDFSNVFALSSMELSAKNTTTAANVKTNQISATRPAAQIKRSSFLTNVFGPDTYQSLEHLNENPDAVWVIKDGEYPELYYNVLRDITLSAVENGEISVDKSQAVDDELVTVTAKANEGYELNKIYVNGEEIVGNSFYVDGDSDIYATFAEKTPEYKIEVKAADNATASLTNLDSGELRISAVSDETEISALDGEEIQVSTNAEDEYTVDAVYVNGEEIAGDSFIVTDNSTVTLEVASISTDIKAETYDAADIGNFSATLSGKIYGNDENALRYIRYWVANEPDVIYVTETESGAGDFTITVDELKAETEYCYQMAETGEVKSFTTTNVPDYDPYAPSDPSDIEHPTTQMTYEIQNAIVEDGTISFDVVNISSESPNGVLMIIGYDENGIYTAMKRKAISGISGGSSKSYELAVPKDSLQYKLFIWDSLDNMKPLAEPVSPTK